MDKYYLFFVQEKNRPSNGIIAVARNTDDLFDKARGLTLGDVIVTDITKQIEDEGYVVNIEKNTVH